MNPFWWLALLWFAGPVGWGLGQRRRAQRAEARVEALRVDLANANERTRFAEDQRDQWAAAFPVEHDARRRLWRCRTHVYGGIR